MILDATMEGTMMIVDAKQATKTIDALASTYYQAKDDTTAENKKEVLELNTTYALLA